MKPKEITPVMTLLPCGFGVTLAAGRAWSGRWLDLAVLQGRGEAETGGRRSQAARSRKGSKFGAEPRGRNFEANQARRPRQELGYGEKPLTRKEAVAALERLGFSKSAAYRALSTQSKVATFIEAMPDGQIEWKG